MKNLSEKEKEKILDKIANIEESIIESRKYIDSENCRKCSEIYSKIFRLEQQLLGLQRKLKNERD